MTAVATAGGRRLTSTTAAASFGFALVQLDVSIVNVALARIGEKTGATVSGLSWVVDAYTVTFASFLLAGGALGDRFGARRMYLVGLGLFSLASLACGLAPDAGVLIAARIIQGIGAGFAVPCSLALLTYATAGDDAARTRAIGLWTAAASVALSLGPLAGGLLVETIGWRSGFLVNVPLGAAGIWFTRRVAEDPPRRDGVLDPAGQALAIVTLLSLTGAVIEAGHLGLDTVRVVAGFAIAAVSGAGFLAVEARSRHPMLPLEFFRDPTFSAASVVGVAINLSLYGTIFVLGLTLQQTLGYSPIRAGLAFLPFPLVLGTANLAASRIGRRFGHCIPMSLGLAVACVGYRLLGAPDASTHYVAILPGLLVIPAGVGLAVPLMTSSLLAVVPPSRAGIAAGVLNTARQAGGGIGVALFGALMAANGVAGIWLAVSVSTGLMAAGVAVALTGIRRRAPQPA